MDHRRRPPSAPRIAARAAVLALLVVAAVLAGCGEKETTLGPAGDPPQLTGVQLHPLWAGVSTRDAARELDLARRHGADTVRIDIGWSSLELDGKGRVSRPYARRLDAFLEHARRRRVRVIGTLLGTPCWASSAPASLRRGCRGAWWTRDVADYPPRRARDFADAAGYVARRWGRRLHALEIWNEPNLPAFLRSDDPARAYARLVRAAYRPVKRAAPRLTVLAGATLRSDGEFLTDLYERGRIRGHYDAISYHPYSSDPAAPAHADGREFSFVAGTRWLREIMVAHGDRDGELWATEAGASTCPRALNPSCVSRAAQADRVEQYVRAARRFPYLRAIVIYNLRDKGDSRADIENGYGLVNRDLRAKPALHAFRAAAGASP
jgi:hypothetical protein